MADNGDIVDLDGNDEVEIEHVRRPIPRYTNIRQRHHATNMLDRMNDDELSSYLDRIINSLILATFMYVKDDVGEEILLSILMQYQTVMDYLME